jgi:hypothetical protein
MYLSQNIVAIQKKLASFASLMKDMPGVYL